MIYFKIVIYEKLVFLSLTTCNKSETKLLVHLIELESLHRNWDYLTYC